MLQDLELEIRANTDSLDKIVDAIGEVDKSITGMADKIDKAMSSIDSSTRRARESQRGFGDTTSSAQERSEQAIRRTEGALRAQEKAIEQDKFAIERLGQASNQTASSKEELSDSVEKSNSKTDESKRSTDEAVGSLTDMQIQVQNLTKSVQVALGPLSGVASRITALSALFSRNAVIVASLIAAFTAFTVATSRAITEGQLFEQDMLRINAVLEATGRTASATAEDINDMARRIGEATMTSAREARGAATQLATFRNVSVSSFEEAITAAQGMAAVMGGNLQSNIRQLGRVLDDPIRNINALNRVGIQFTATEERKVQAMIRTNRRAEAQAFILERLNSFTKLAVDEAQQLSGAFDTMSERISAVFEESAATSALLTTLKSVMDNLNESLADFLANEDAVRGLGESFETFSRAVGRSLNFVINNARELAGLLGGLLTVSIVRFLSPAFMSLINPLMTVSTQMGVAATRTLALSTAKNVLITTSRRLLVTLGPLGLAYVGATMALDKFFNSAAQVPDLLEDASNEIEINTKFLDANTAARKENIAMLFQEVSAEKEVAEARQQSIREQIKANNDQIRSLNNERSLRGRNMAQIEELKQENEALSEELKDQQTVVTRLNAHFRVYEQTLKLLNDRNTEFNEILGQLTDNTMRLREEWDKAAVEAHELELELESAKAQFQDFKNLMDTFEANPEVFEAFAMSIGMAGASIEDIEEMYKRMITSIKSGDEEVGRADTSWQRINDTFNEVSDNIRTIEAELAGTPFDFDLSFIRELEEVTTSGLRKIAAAQDIVIDSNATREELELAVARAIFERRKEEEELQAVLDDGDILGNLREQIQEQRRLNEALRRSEEQYRAVRREMEIVERTEEEINRLRQQGVEITAEIREEVRGLVSELVDQKEQYDEINEKQRESKDVAEEVGSVWDETIRGIQRAFADTFEEVFRDGIRNFSNLTDRVLDLFYRTVAEMAAAWAVSGIFGSSGLNLPGFGGGGFPGMGGGGTNLPPGSGQLLENIPGMPEGGITGVINRFGTQMGFGQGSGFVGPMPQGTFTAASLSQVLGAGALGFVGGGFVGEQLFGDEGNASNIGGALGATAGMLTGNPLLAALGGVLGGAIGGGLFGSSSWSDRKVRIEMEIEGGDLETALARHQGKSGGLFRSSSRRTKREDLPPELLEPIQQGLDNITEIVNIAGENLGIELEPLDDFTTGRNRIRIDNANEEEIMEQIQEWLATVSNEMVHELTDALDITSMAKRVADWGDMGQHETADELAHLFERMQDNFITGAYRRDATTRRARGIAAAGDLDFDFTGTEDEIINQFDEIIETFQSAIDGFEQFRQPGEQAIETFVRLSDALSTLNPALKMLRLDMLDASLMSGQFAEDIMMMMGGVEESLEKMSQFSQRFYTEEERAQHQRKDLAKVLADGFEDLNRKIPQSREHFRDIVNSLDLTTERGRELFAGMMNLNFAFDTVIGTIQDVSRVVNDTFAETRLMIQEALMGEEELYNFRRDRAHDLVDELDQAETVEDITRLTSEIDRMVNQIWSSLDEVQQDKLGREFIEFIDDSQDLAQNRLRDIQDDLLNTEQQYELAAQQNQDAAFSQNEAAGMQMEAARQNQAAAGAMAAAVADFSRLAVGRNFEAGGL